MTWRGITLQVRHRSNWLSTGFDHIEVEATPRERLPITETGYRSHFIDPDDLADYDGNAIIFVLFWLETTAKRVGWSGQKSLF